ncbi:MAG: hypothetical protein OEX77_08285, partial [Candidatus Bathyarchaeota archaeon]|nr:hypothetical protein [Candidatus Bathyarchaeota archaeon]
KSERFLPILPLKLRQFLTDMIWSILDRRSLIAPLVISKHHVQKLSTIRFYGMNVNVPFDVEKYLEYRYGSNWKISTKEWKYEDDGAIRSVRLCDFLADI